MHSAMYSVMSLVHVFFLCGLSRVLRLALQNLDCTFKYFPLIEGMTESQGWETNRRVGDQSAGVAVGDTETLSTVAKTYSFS